jgi:hypothetical protein
MLIVISHHMADDLSGALCFFVAILIICAIAIRVYIFSDLRDSEFDHRNPGQLCSSLNGFLPYEFALNMTICLLSLLKSSRSWIVSILTCLILLYTGFKYHRRNLEFDPLKIVRDLRKYEYECLFRIIAQIITLVCCFINLLFAIF